MDDEFELIAAIRERLARKDERIEIGIGDDAAILKPTTRGTVLSVDVVVEGVHFDRRWLAWEDVGWRGYSAALSDLAAMGARPSAGLLSMILPSTMGDDDVLAIVDGVAAAADAFGAPVVGGNVSSGTQLSMSTTVVGEAPARPITRSGARIGDAVYVTGSVGAAALGLALLSSGEAARAGALPFVARWRRPRPRFDVVPALEGVATSAADVSDGLAQDLGHLCEASGVGAVIEEARLPLEPGHDALARALGRDGMLLALAGGEDYELVFTAPRSRVAPGIATEIGAVVEGSKVRVLDRHGQERTLARAGHRHR